MLPSPQTERFYQVYLALIGFVNQERQVIPDLRSPVPGERWRPEDVLRIRQTLWKNDRLLDDFVRRNPARLSPGDLALAESWKHRRAGNFFIVKHLKKHSIFIADGGEEIFAVKGLHSTIEAVLPFPAPVVVKAVLLPVEADIVYDTIMEPYGVTFGSGIRSRLQAAYADARERGTIITTLTDPAKPQPVGDPADQAAATNAKVLQAFRRHLNQTNQSDHIIARDLATAADFASRTLPHSLREIPPQSLGTYLAGLPATGRAGAITGLKRLIKFLRDTDRLDERAAEVLLLMLKL